MKLYHISDCGDIDIFRGREANLKVWPHLTKRYVWSVSSEMVHNYFFPRNCPRVCWMIGPDTTPVDKTYFKSFGNQKSIIFIEKAWMEELKNTTLYRYEFSDENFYPVDYCAGYYVSEHDEVPLKVEVVTDLINELEKSNVLLVPVDELEPYRQLSVKRNFRFSNIRMKFCGIKNCK